MNILYLSHLSNALYAGPNFSVPASIKAQQQFDNCLWVNLSGASQKHWNDVDAYHNYRDFTDSSMSLDLLPSPFNHPDVVVFEGFYHIETIKISRQLRKKNIPYIIVPRGSLTRQAMNNHAWLKKRLAHLLYFDSYCRHAAAIQYLTEQERNDAYRRWCKHNFVIPNGFNPPATTKADFSTDGMKMVFVGRPDAYHKGLDVLWEAIAATQSEMRKAHVTLDFYAPKNNGDWARLQQETVDKRIGDIVIMHDKIGGKDKEDAILNADLFVLTSRFEGHPMGLVEALAYGLPAFVTPGSNMAREIHDYDAGWVTECNVYSIKETLRKLIVERELLLNKGRNALKLAENYRWNNIAKAFHEEIMQLL